MADAPILLTDPNGLSDAARGRLESLCPSRVFIVGGNAAVSPDVERQIKEMLGSGCAVFRVAGQSVGVDALCGEDRQRGGFGPVGRAVFADVRVAARALGRGA